MTQALDARGAVIVFDGVCVLCNRWVRFVLRHDRRRRYRFASMQGHAGRSLLAAHGLDPVDPASFLLIEYDRGPVPRVQTDTAAIVQVVAGFGGAWRLVRLAALVPRAVRDPLYSAVAKRRYRWFGRHPACPVPSVSESDRFL